MGTQSRITCAIALAASVMGAAHTTARATVTLTPASEIRFAADDDSDHRCSIGFFGQVPGDNHSYAVTAGHCTTTGLGDAARDADGDRIGTVVGWKADGEDDTGSSTGTWGATVVQLDSGLTITPWFTDARDPAVGTDVRVAGSTDPDGIGGTVTGTESTSGQSLLDVSTPIRQGDSGGPLWFENRVLGGIVLSTGQVIPIEELLATIRQSQGLEGFTVSSV